MFTSIRVCRVRWCALERSFTYSHLFLPTDERMGGGYRKCPTEIAIFRLTFRESESSYNYLDFHATSFIRERELQHSSCALLGASVLQKPAEYVMVLIALPKRQIFRSITSARYSANGLSILAVYDFTVGVPRTLL